MVPVKNIQSRLSVRGVGCLGLGRSLSQISDQLLVQSDIVTRVLCRPVRVTLTIVLLLLLILLWCPFLSNVAFSLCQRIGRVGCSVVGSGGFGHQLLLALDRLRAIEQVEKIGRGVLRWGSLSEWIGRGRLSRLLHNRQRLDHCLHLLRLLGVASHQSSKQARGVRGGRCGLVNLVNMRRELRLRQAGGLMLELMLLSKRLVLTVALIRLGWRDLLLLLVLGCSRRGNRVLRSLALRARATRATELEKVQQIGCAVTIRSTVLVAIR